MGRIQTLSDDLINKIAAGEVVERPASVVKELGENALDAGAKYLRVSLRGGGLVGITVSDDGHGMSREDAVLSLGRHATSKLRTLDDLSSIESFGFRGEALAAISAVSRFTMVTSEPNADSGTRLTVEGPGTLDVMESAPAPGTRIDVDDLFFNTPARRKFLKRESTELGHAEEAVIRLALAHPEVGFALEHDGRSMIASPPGAELKERIAAALGPEVFSHLLPVDEHRLGLSLTGFIASPEFTFPNTRGLYTFINRRFVRDRAMTSAIQRAFQEQLPAGRQPVAVLFLTVDPRAVDVNVHPQKLEVRFADPKSLQELIASGVRRALERAPWRNEAGETVPAGPAHYALAVERFLARAQSGPLPPVWEGAAGELPLAPAFGQAHPGINEAPPEGFFKSLKWVGELGQRLWVCEGPGGTLVVIDPVAAHERLAVSGWTAAMLKGESALGPPGLFSVTVSLDDAARTRFLEAAPALAKLGITVESFGPRELLLRGLPWQLTPEAVAALAADLLPALPEKGNDASTVALAGVLKTLAHHGATAQPRSATASQARQIFEALDEADFTFSCVRSHIVVHQMPMLELLRHSGGYGVAR